MLSCSVCPRGAFPGRQRHLQPPEADPPTAAGGFPQRSVRTGSLPRIVGQLHDDEPHNLSDVHRLRDSRGAVHHFRACLRAPQLYGTQARGSLPTSGADEMLCRNAAAATSAPPNVPAAHAGEFPPAQSLARRTALSHTEPRNGP